MAYGRATTHTPRKATVSKGLDQKRETKKKPSKSLQEKREAKRAKREARR